MIRTNACFDYTTFGCGIVGSSNSYRLDKIHPSVRPNTNDLEKGVPDTRAEHATKRTGSTH